MVGMELEVCAFCASERKQDKERAVTGSRLCALCTPKKKPDRERVGMGLKVCTFCASKIKQDKERVVVTVHCLLIVLSHSHPYILKDNAQ